MFLFELLFENGEPEPVANEKQSYKYNSRQNNYPILFEYVIKKVCLVLNIPLVREDQAAHYVR